MKKLLVVGCSFTKGTGLTDEDTNETFWVNQLHKLAWSDHTLLNLAERGRNNEWIFVEAMTAMQGEHYDTILIGWTQIPRFNINIGLEMHSTVTNLAEFNADINLTAGGKVTSKEQHKLGNQLRKYHHDHWHILDLIKYINALVLIQTQRNGNIWFVNSLCPWSTGYFNKQKFEVPSELPMYVQQLLSVHARDNNEIKQLYDKIHDQYTYYGGIHEENWLNLYNSLVSMQIDDASLTDKHPGILSQPVFANNLIQRLENTCIF